MLQTVVRFAREHMEGHMITFIIGLVLFIGGIIATMSSPNAIFIGAIGVGLLNMIIGGAALARNSRARNFGD